MARSVSSAWAAADLSVLTMTLRLEETSGCRVLMATTRLRALSLWMRGYEGVCLDETA